MKNTFKIEQATRVGINPLLAAYAESGCGKTMSALLLARGLAGPNGKIVVADSEARRASLYADVIPGGFQTFDLCAPFSPQRYIDAIDAIEESGAAVGVIDSGSHEWEGTGGVLDMAGEVESRSGKGLHCWKGPKFEHGQFVQRLLRSKIPFILCLRAKYKSRQVRGTQDMVDAGTIQPKQIGKAVILKDENTSPIQADDFIFEATCHFEILQDHSINLTKCSHPKLRECFPAKGPIKIEHGEMIAKWCANSAPKSSDLAKLKLQLWNNTKPIHNGDKAKLIQWLVDEMILSPDQTLDGLTVEQLPAVISKTETKLSGMPN